MELRQLHQFIAVAETLNFSRAAHRGMGVALVPSVSARLAARDVVFRSVQGLPASAGISIAMATRADTHNPAALRFRELALHQGTATPSTSSRVRAAR